MNDSENFYESLSSVYHLIFENWDESIHQQGKIISKLLPSASIASPVLDCACGIGTQALALATLGYTVEGIDLSPSEVERAKKEADIRHLSINFRVDDMRQLITAPLKKYGAVINMDNSLPHLNSNEEIITALIAMRDRLRSEGVLLLSLRDYGKLMGERLNCTEPKFFQDGPYRRIIHQIWDWQDERRYIVHLYITYETKDGWKSHHTVGQYRAITIDEIVKLTMQAGFTEVVVLEPIVTGFYQPIVRGIVN